jgi:hypothetical protein
MGIPNHRAAWLRHAQEQICASPPRTARPRFIRVAGAAALAVRVHFRVGVAFTLNGVELRAQNRNEMTEWSATTTFSDFLVLVGSVFCYR